MSPHPTLSIQGERNKAVLTEDCGRKETYRCRVIYIEGMDRMFKLFWISNIQYTPQCSLLFIFLQTVLYNLPYRPVKCFRRR